MTKVIVLYFKNLFLNIWNVRNDIYKFIMTTIISCYYICSVVRFIAHKHYQIELNSSSDMILLVIGIIAVSFVNNCLFCDRLKYHGFIIFIVFSSNSIHILKTIKIIDDKIYLNWPDVLPCLIVSIITYFVLYRLCGKKTKKCD